MNIYPIVPEAVNTLSAITTLAATAIETNIIKPKKARRVKTTAAEEAVDVVVVNVNDLVAEAVAPEKKKKRSKVVADQAAAPLEAVEKTDINLEQSESLGKKKRKKKDVADADAAVATTDIPKVKRSRANVGQTAGDISNCVVNEKDTSLSRKKTEKVVEVVTLIDATAGFSGGGQLVDGESVTAPIARRKAGRKRSKVDSSVVDASLEIIDLVSP